jgi:nucleoside phosphorylase
MTPPADHGAPELLLLAAHPLELEGLEPELTAQLRTARSALRVAALEVGVGMTAAGAGAMRHLLAHRPRAAILLGSYGQYPDAGSFEPGRLLAPTELRALDAAALAGKAAFPAPMPIALLTDGALRAALCGDGQSVLQAALGTTLAITTDDALARALGRASGCVGENLEALAIGLACQSAGVRFAALLGCTNQVGSQGREQWRMHHATAARACAQRVLRWLAAGGAGLHDGSA